MGEPIVSIRPARIDDAGAIAAIYAHHVANGTASFDTRPRSAQATADKIADCTAHGWPFLVAERDGRIQGYAYATQFRDREGYRFTAEDSIYVHPDWMGLGIGGTLLDALIELSVAFGFRTLIAVIGGGEAGSVAVHASRGFREVGRLHAAGYKHGRWLDNVYMQLEMKSAAGY